MNKQLPTDEYLISLSDVLKIIKNNSRHVLFGALFMALVGMGYAITRPVRYSAEGTFKEKGKANNSSKGMEVLFLNPSSVSESDAISVMKSRGVIESVIRNLGMQAYLPESKSLFQPFKNVYNNIKTEIAYLRMRKYPVVTDYTPTIQFRDVDYDGDYVRQLKLVFTDNEHFKVFSSDGTLLVEESIGHPFRHEDFTMTVVTTPNVQHNQEYVVKLLPLYLVVEELNDALTIGPDKLDKNMIRLLYVHTIRCEACNVVNSIMAAYQDYLNSEDNRYANKQLDYLRKRHNETFEKQTRAMKDYADELSKDLSVTGYSSSEKELAFLAKIHLEYNEQLMKIELSMKHLEELLNSDSLLTKNSYGIDFTPINPFVQELEQFKQQRDALAIALRQKIWPDTQSIGMEFEHQIVNLDQIKKDSHDINHLMAQLEADQPINKNLHIFSDPSLLVKSWVERVQEMDENYRDATAENKVTLLKERELQKNNALNYLKNLLKLNDTHAQVIQERLSNHYDPKLEYQGIDLDTAKQLYLIYCKDVGHLEAEIRQNDHIIKELEDPYFEVNSLSSIIKDTVAQEIIAKSSALALSLRDEENRSSKEIARTHEELAFQKKFLSEHLVQTNMMLELRKNLLQEKLYSLQGATLELVHQKITILQKQIRDFIASKLAGLQLEKKLFEKNLAEVNRKMASLPNKWVSEQILNQNLILNKSIVEEITRTVEAKNISNHLEIIKSSPIDVAFASPRPVSPKIVIFTLLGALVGFVMASVFFVVQAMVRGVRASATNLRYNQQYVAGDLHLTDTKKPFTDEDLETLRRIMNHYGSRPKHPILLIKGEGVDYSQELAQLYKLSGSSVVVVSIAFDQPARQGDLPGVLQVLEEKAQEPKIISLEGIDYIFSGGITRYSSELLASPSFITLMEHLQSKYAVVVVVSKASPVSAEAQGLLNTFENVVVSVTDEKLLDLKMYIDESLSKKKKVTYVMNMSSS